MARQNHLEVMMVRSYVDGSTLYSGSDHSDAQEVIKDYNDKCTLYVFRRERESYLDDKITITKFRANGRIEDKESFEIENGVLDYLLNMLR